MSTIVVEFANQALLDRFILDGAAMSRDDIGVMLDAIVFYGAELNRRRRRFLEEALKLSRHP